MPRKKWKEKWRNFDCSRETQLARWCKVLHLYLLAVLRTGRSGAARKKRLPNGPILGHFVCVQVQLRMSKIAWYMTITHGNVCCNEDWGRQLYISATNPICTEGPTLLTIPYEMICLQFTSHINVSLLPWDDIEALRPTLQELYTWVLFQGRPHESSQVQTGFRRCAAFTDQGFGSGGWGESRRKYDSVRGERDWAAAEAMVAAMYSAGCERMGMVSTPRVRWRGRGHYSPIWPTTMTRSGEWVLVSFLSIISVDDNHITHRRALLPLIPAPLSKP